MNQLKKWLKNKYVSNGLYLLGFAVLYFFYLNPKVDFNKENKSGIHFETISITQALQKAKAENKPIFVDVYATWCGPCKRLKKFTFSDEDLGVYFNENFINVSIDGETQLGSQLHYYYPFDAFPTLFFINPDGTLIDKETGFSFAFSLLSKGKDIVEDLRTN